METTKSIMIKRKWSEAYARKADAFASTKGWQQEALHILSLEQFKGFNVLDFACNTGRFLQLAKPRFPSLMGLGVDINPSALMIAKTRMPHFIWETSLSNTPDSTVDYTVFMHGINQVTDLEHTMSEIWRVMKEGAGITVVTHNPWHFKFFGIRNLFNGYKSDPTIIREPTKGQLKQIMWDNGFLCTSTYWFGDNLFPFLKNRIVFNGRKGGLNAA